MSKRSVIYRWVRISCSLRLCYPNSVFPNSGVKESNINVLIYLLLSKPCYLLCVSVFGIKWIWRARNTYILTVDTDIFYAAQLCFFFCPKELNFKKGRTFFQIHLCRQNEQQHWNQRKVLKLLCSIQKSLHSWEIIKRNKINSAKSFSLWHGFQQFDQWVDFWWINFL